MESSELHKNFKPILDNTKLQFYYGNFKYRGMVKIPFIHYFRYVKSERDFDKKLEREVYNLHKNNYQYPFKKIRLKKLIEQDKTNSIDTIKKFVSYKEKNSIVGVKFKINYNQLTIYFNDYNDVQALTDIFDSGDFKFNYTYAQIIPNFKKGVVYHKDPKYKYRLYFKSSKLYDKDKENFLEFLDTQGFKKSISLNLSIIGFNKNFLFLTSTHHVDYNDESMLTVIALTYPNLIGKICTIEKLAIE